MPLSIRVEFMGNSGTVQAVIRLFWPEKDVYFMADISFFSRAIQLTNLHLTGQILFGSQ
jgi:hypothetical protein